MDAIEMLPRPEDPAPVPTQVADGDDGLTIDELGARIVGMAGRLASAMCRWLLLVAAFDARGGAFRCTIDSGRAEAAHRSYFLEWLLERRKRAEAIRRQPARSRRRRRRRHPPTAAS